MQRNEILKKVACATILLGFIIAPSLVKPCIITFNPNNPAASGYGLVFDSEFNNSNDMDLSCPGPGRTSAGCTDPPGKNWYLNSWTFPNTVTIPADFSFVAPPFTSHKSTVLHLNRTTDSTTNGGWMFSTMGPSTGNTVNGLANATGHVFQGGWYVEARFSTEYQTCTGTNPCVFTGTVVTAPGADNGNGHATVWSYAVDHYEGATEFAEDDMQDGIQGTNNYLAGLIDWLTNVHPVATGCVNPSNTAQVTLGGCDGLSVHYTDRTSVHIYGQLWIPATPSTNGTLTNFIDGVQVSQFSWAKYNGTTTPTGNQIGAVIDTDHMQVNFGNDPPHAAATIGSQSWWDWIHVWQLPAAAAASGNTFGITPQPGFTGSVYP